MMNKVTSSRAAARLINDEIVLPLPLTPKTMNTRAASAVAAVATAALAAELMVVICSPDDVAPVLGLRPGADCCHGCCTTSDCRTP